MVSNPLKLNDEDEDEADAKAPGNFPIKFLGYFNLYTRYFKSKNILPVFNAEISGTTLQSILQTK